MTSVQSFGQTQDGPKIFYGFSQIPPQRAVFLVRFLGRRQPVVAGDQGDHIQLFRFEAPQTAVTDEVLGVFVVVFVADVYTDVVK